MKCPLCGKPVEDGAAFCPYCGMQLEPEAPGAQAAKEAPPAAQPERESAPAQPFAAQAGGAAENPAAGTAPGGGVVPPGAQPRRRAECRLTASRRARRIMASRSPAQPTGPMPLRRV